MSRDDLCDVYWGSHGCDLPRFHDGGPLSHVCHPCPPDCEYPKDEYDDECTVHCGSKPIEGGVQFGDDVEFFNKPQWKLDQEEYAARLRRERMACPEGGEHDYVYVKDEYNGLSGGGDYEIYNCSKCDKRHYSQLPD